ncbi:coproporphyrinogen III oxidase family protein [Helicobacter sp. MIT 00-7814]|uniref:radical SAM family heme chaperone HemW n=1 Tax=unclassified Helicobacter TaxID=2593540 RepID=UPI000E1E4442|nr:MULTISPECIES: radical SAM family heme chaperone HemW [unclassified Helicobacter]RDU57229.1 coproporphyrinogen III oxidase family protein [Helicobacter sp. MIT 00-7814]RDU57781.1 coproporphyrinogen III oxidase family protein [Helicobacter sp. MIT 99-10781]
MLLYIHIPFCASKCGYCAFNSYVGEKNLHKPYIDALCKDLKHSLSAQNYPKISSVFFGGGTPNLLDSALFEPVFEIFMPHIQKNCEITMEGNVNLLSPSWCAHMRSLGVNRLSIGVQSFLESKLKFLEREHSQKDIFKAFDFALGAGFENLSCDIITGTPQDCELSLESEFQNLAKLPLQHISAYSLSIDEGSRFAKNTAKARSLPPQDLSTLVRAHLQALGFSQYEVSNYAKNENFCRHNLGYWEAKEYIGCGAGAFSRVGSERTNALKGLKEYITNPHFREVEPLSAEDLRTEEIMLGLRCKSGVRVELLDSKKCADLLESNKAHIQTRDFPTQTNAQAKRDFLVSNDFFLADSLALYLL